MLETTTELAPRYLTFASATDYCGLSEKALRKLAAQGRFRTLRPLPGRILIDRQDLDRFLDSTAQKEI
jgi:hypothetical protein